MNIHSLTISSKRVKDNLVIPIPGMITPATVACYGRRAAPSFCGRTIINVLGHGESLRTTEKPGFVLRTT
jgi:hypothetical protein